VRLVNQYFAKGSFSYRLKAFSREDCLAASNLV